MASERDLRRAIVAIGKADSGTGGLVDLVGQATPVVRAGDRGARSRPWVTVQFPVTRRHGAQGDLSYALGQFDVAVDAAAGGLESQIADRLETVMSNGNFDGQDLDVAPVPGIRRDTSDLEEGGQRLTLEIDFLFNRS